MPEDAWDPCQYERFRAERRAPFLDLLALVRPRPGMRVVDLGCGTGELTAELHRRLGAAATLGVDSSAAMLGRSATFAAPGLAFAERDIRDLGAGERWDLVFSNAALQWLPDHPALFRTLAAMVAERGQLAVQLPANYDHPSHRVALEVAAEPAFREALGGFAHEVSVLAPEAYAALLHRLGFRAQQVRLQVYAHLLADRAEVVEWVQGTLLTPYRERLPAAHFDRFLARYRERLLPALDPTRPHLFPFKRLLLWAGREE